MSEEAVDAHKQTHGMFMIIGWFALTHIILWCTFFKQWRIAIYLHIIGAIVIVLLASIGTILILAALDYDYEMSQQFAHNGIGAIIFFTVPVLLLSGFITKFVKPQQQIKPQTVKRTTLAHKIIGWIFLIVSRIPLYTGNQEFSDALIFVIVDVISFSAFWLLKLRPCKAYKGLTTQYSHLRQISTQKQLKIYSNNYFIFCNYVYSIYTILQEHPGGAYIIRLIMGREVQRFIYGGQFLQGQKGDPHVHSTHSIKLASQPLAKIKIPSPFSGMSELNQVMVDSIRKIHDSTDVYLLYLKGTFEYKGYSSIQQIGRFYSLTVDQKDTRLYSPVNFASPHNIQILKKNLGCDFLLEKTPRIMNTFAQTKQDKMIQLYTIEDNMLSNRPNSYLPLMIKKYPDGRFTKKLLRESAQHQLQISQPQGFGLSLKSFPPGKIVMFSGGTGFYPFSDLIDLLYKQSLVEKKSSNLEQLLNNDPILSKKPFDGYTFEIYCSLRNFKQIHPLSLKQMDKLSQFGKLKCTFKLQKHNTKEFTQLYPHIQVQTSRFEKVIADLAKNQDSFSGVLVCGPGPMSSAVINQLKEQNIGPEKYRII